MFDRDFIVRRARMLFGIGLLLHGAAVFAAAPATQPDVTSLTQALAAEDVNARVAAIEALRALGPAAAAAAPALVAQLEHPLGWVRSAAADALLAMGEAAVPAVLDAFNHGSPAARQRASYLLASFGPAARAALPDLRAAAEKAATPEQAAQLREFIAQIETPDESVTAPVKAPVPAAGTPTHIPTLGEAGWPQFHGPRRDLASAETGLARQWPAAGPPLLWTAKGLGRGFSSVSIAGGRIFTMGDRQDGTTESQFVIALDLATQKELWAARVGPVHAREGPRCTPTVDGELLYALGTEGDLYCLETATGKPRWHKNLAVDFGGAVMNPLWKWSESPLVDGKVVVCTPGSPDAALAALDKLTGNPVWKCAIPKLGPKGKDGAGFSSIVAAEICGVPQYVQFIGRGVIGVEAATGRLLWSYNLIASTVANITHPLVAGDQVFVANGYNTGSVLLNIKKEGTSGTVPSGMPARGLSPNLPNPQFKAEPVYTLKARQFSNHHGGIVLAGGHVYGGIGDNAGAPACVELATGAVKWQAKAPEGGSAAVLTADGLLLLRYDRFGMIALAEATPDGFKMKSSFHPPAGEGPAWAHMALLDGRLYLRHADLLMCYDLRKKQ